VETVAELNPPLDRERALLEADACLECGGPNHAAPCSLACPAGIDVPAFIAAIARDEPAVASRLIFEENVLGGTCARVCPAELLCEGACVLVHEGRPPIAIARLQRYATDTEPPHARSRKQRPTGRRVAVVGAGPAGLACAGELARLGHDTTVFDARPEAGGLARYAIAPYRLLREPLPEETAALERAGVTFVYGCELATRDELRRLEQEFDAVVLAVGLGPDSDVAYSGNDLAGVWESLEFVEALKTGAAPALGERVIVVGGGNTAIDVARESVRLGAAHVTVVYRRTEAEMPAYPQEVAEARAEGVRFEWLAAPTRFIGSRRVAGVECVRMALGEPDASGRARPEPVAGSEFVLLADTVVKAIGQQSRDGLFALIGGLDTDRGKLVVDPETGATTRRGWFAAGDAVNGGATVVEAVRAAKVAALGVDAFLGSTR
jgi:glutamate synthase (NADPH/NADH) small chain